MNLEPSRFFVPKRHIRVSSSPVGRASSDIFNTGDQPSPVRKVRDNQKSSIVNTGVGAGIDPNGNLKRSSLSPHHQQNTKSRLFGANGDASGGEFSPRRNNDTWRSNIMFSDADGQTMPDGTKRTPKKRIPSGGGNPITGTPLRRQMNGFTPSHTNGVSNGIGSYDHDDVLTVEFGSDGHGPVAVLNGHGNVRENGDHHHHHESTTTPRRRAAAAQANKPQ